jgi:TrmH family RNA methyltransferase
VTKGEKNYARIPITVAEFANKVHNYDQKIAILFGPEDKGLAQEELERCDILITIPADDSYPILNLSHAATIVFYEISQAVAAAPTPADDDEKERMLAFFDMLLDSIDYPEQRRENTSVMFRRLIGRAVPTKWEYQTILGVFKDAAKLIDQER